MRAWILPIRGWKCRFPTPFCGLKRKKFVGRVVWFGLYYVFRDSPPKKKSAPRPPGGAICFAFVGYFWTFWFGVHDIGSRCRGGVWFGVVAFHVVASRACVVTLTRVAPAWLGWTYHVVAWLVLAWLRWTYHVVADALAWLVLRWVVLARNNGKRS